MAHLFEISHTDKTPFSETDRLCYDDVLRQKQNLEAQTAFIALSESMGCPVLVLNSHKQVVYANEAALNSVNEHDHPDHVLGLRFGEFLGRKHKFNGKICKDPSSCANCNELPAILSALDGSFSEEEGILSIYRETPENSLDYKVYCLPFSLDKKAFALLKLMRLQA
jgi:hypothetical protein